MGLISPGLQLTANRGPLWPGRRADEPQLAGRSRPRRVLGSDAGLSTSTISRLTEAWQAEHADFNVRLEQDRLCCLVIVGVRPDGSKELIALADGYREDTESWLDLLRGLKKRGPTGPSLAVGDGALGFWGVLREVFPAAKEQRCWVYVTANVLAALPIRLQADAKAAISKIYSAATRTDALTAVRAFADEFAEHPKEVKKISGKLDTLLAFYDPAEHWIHLRTTNPIESTFSTVRLRTRVTRGAGSRLAALAMAYELLDAAQDRWRKINAPHLVPLVRAGAVFIDGKHQERTTNQTDTKTTQEDVAA